MYTPGIQLWHGLFDQGGDDLPVALNYPDTCHLLYKGDTGIFQKRAGCALLLRAVSFYLGILTAPSLAHGTDKFNNIFPGRLLPDHARR